MYEIESSFWFNLLLILGIFFILTSAFNMLMRKWLKVKKPKMFSNYPVNEKHRKIDWGIRGVFILLMIIGAFVNSNRTTAEPVLFLEPWFLLLTLVGVTEIVRAVMEKKYAENPNAYLFTLSQLGFSAILLISLFGTNFWGII